MTGISGASFVAWALPITIASLAVAIILLNHFAPQIEEWGKRHISNK